MGIIYKLRAPNGSEYIGQTITPMPKRLSLHKQAAISSRNSSPLLCAAIREFGIESFDVQIVCECDDDLLDEKETKNIRKYNTLFPYGLNVMSGGCGGSKKIEYANSSNDQIPVDFNVDELPDTISEIDDGYVVKYPGRDDKLFNAASSKFDNLLRALSYHRFWGYKARRIPDMYLQNYKGSFVVKIPGYPDKYFVSKTKSDDEKRADALKFLMDIMSNEEKPELPGSIRTLRDGFRVKFPGIQDKHFVAANKTAEDKYQEAKKFLEELREHGVPEPEFPKVKGLQKYRNGFRVRLPGQELVRFEDASKTKEHLWKEAKAYIDSLASDKSINSS